MQLSGVRMHAIDDTCENRITVDNLALCRSGTLYEFDTMLSPNKLRWSVGRLGCSRVRALLRSTRQTPISGADGDRSVC